MSRRSAIEILDRILRISFYASDASGKPQSLALEEINALGRELETSLAAEQEPNPVAEGREAFTEAAALAVQRSIESANAGAPSAAEVQEDRAWAVAQARYDAWQTAAQEPARCTRDTGCGETPCICDPAKGDDDA